jgi:hypothetical protein
MLRDMRPSELGEWMALWQVSPWGADRSDLAAGIIASTIANVNRDSKRRAAAFRPSEFMAYHVEPEVTPEELAGKIWGAFGKIRR